MIALDTNLLVYAHRSGAPEHTLAKICIERAIEHPAGWGISASCIPEYWGVVTHPSCAGGPSKPEQASAFIAHLLEDGAGQLWQPGPGFAMRLLHKATELNVAGPRIFDLQIALTAYENGAVELWTHDHAFVRLPGLRVINPLD